MHICEGLKSLRTMQPPAQRNSPNGPRGRDSSGVPMISRFLEKYPKMMLWDAYQVTTLRNNRMVCANGWDIDLDDGSISYDIYNNLCLVFQGLEF